MPQKMVSFTLSMKVSWHFTKKFHQTSSCIATKQRLLGLQISVGGPSLASVATTAQSRDLGN